MRRNAPVVLCTLFCSSLLGATHQRVVVQNWSVPRLSAAPDAAISGRATFVALDPCRVVDTRRVAGTYGGPAFSPGTTRSFDIPGGPCTGIPIAAAYSLNFTIVNFDAGGGFVTAYPSGGTRPLVSTLNFGKDPAYAVANAALVPANAGSIDVYSSGNTNLIIDINGYFIEPAITGVTAGTGISVTGTNNVTVGIDTSGAASGQALSYNGTTTTWSNVINGVTAGTGLTGGGTSGTVSLDVNFAGSGSANTAARSDHSHYARTVIVNSGGSATANGTALLNALAGITTATATNQYLLKLEPGVYDIGSSSLQMKPYVDIEGSGELTTKITRAGFNAFSNGTVNGSDNAELRFLTVENTGTGGSYAIAIYNTSASPRISHVTLLSSGGSSDGIGMYSDGSSPVLDQVTTNVAGGSNSGIGIFIANNSSPVIERTTVNSTKRATGVTTAVFGIDIVINSTGAPIIRNSTAAASGGAGSMAVGVNTLNASGSLVNVVASGTGGTLNFGVQNESSAGTFTFTIDRSSVVGATRTISSTIGYTVMVGASKLDGGAVSAGGGTINCIASYNGNYANAGGFTACP